MNDAADVPSAHDVPPQATDSEGDRPEPGRRDAVLVGLAVTSYGLAVALALLVLITPQVRRLSWALVAACLGFAWLAVVLARRRGARALLGRWLLPLVAFAIGWPGAAAVLTWSCSISVPGLWIVAFFVLALVDCFLVVFLLVDLPRDWKVGVLGLLVVGLMWIPVKFGPPETTVRRLRMELAAPSLARQAQSVLDDPSKAKDMGPFIAYDGRGHGVVGWLRGQGFLGRGPGVVWDPDGVLKPGGSAQTREGYPWDLFGGDCQPIVRDWLYCDMH